MSYYNNARNDIARLAVESKAATKQWMQRFAIGNRGVTKTVVSVIDSYSQNKIAVPVRGRHCLHLQPFDAMSYLKRPYQYRTCPVCNDNVRREELVKMEYFQEIFDHLKKFHPRVERIAVQTDGTWHKLAPSASNHSNNGYESGRRRDNPRNLNHIGSNNGNTVISMNDSNRSNHSIFGSIRNRVKPNNVVPVDVWKMMDEEVFIALNEVRTNPKSLIPDIEHVLMHIKDGVYYAPSKQRTGVRVGQMFHEKGKAHREAIQFLMAQKKLKQFVRSNELNAASKILMEDQSATGNTGHVGSNGSIMGERIKGWKGGCAENVSYGQYTGRDVVQQLIVDDGVLSRGHRINILNEEYLMVGIASGSHPNQKSVCVMDFAMDI